ncbi:ABC transporter permease [Bulleidia sp. HCP3S3_F2]|uniref:ABC transporter permease n=1 Tax=unclassified Bulleidia TaxID=2704656 RepID=UPI003F886E1D
MSEMKYDPSMFEKLDESEKNDEAIAMESKTFLQDTWRRFCSNKLAILGLVVLVIMILLAVFVPVFSQYTYDGQDLANTNALPSATHLLGTDKLGRDILVRICSGMRVTLAIGFTSAAINLCIGIVYGGCAGYFGGRVDMTMMRIVDIIDSVPSLLYTIMILMVFGNSVFSMMLAISLTSWITMARQVRAQVMSLKEMEFAMAAKVIGCSDLRILLKHLVINALGPIIVCLTMMIPSAIFTESSLSFIGIGIQPPACSLGSLANEARQLINTQPLQVVWPVITIALITLSLNFIGDGVGEALEAKR